MTHLLEIIQEHLNQHGYQTTTENIYINTPTTRILGTTTYIQHDNTVYIWNNNLSDDEEINPNDPQLLDKIQNWIDRHHKH